MIVLADDGQARSRILQLCEKSAYGCKIAGIATSYGFDKKFACFWLGDDDTVYCLVDGVMIIAGTIARPEEARQFFPAVGAKRVLCAVRNAEALGVANMVQGDVWKKKLAGAPQALPESGESDIRAVYQLLEDAGLIREFEPFYLDVSHRLRHGTAFIVREADKERLLGCAVVSSVTEKTALLSAVAVDGAVRRQGIGTQLVRQAEALLPGRTVYLLTQKGENKVFYTALGYQKTDTWVQADL